MSPGVKNEDKDTEHNFDHHSELPEQSPQNSFCNDLFESSEPTEGVFGRVDDSQFGNAGFMLSHVLSDLPPFSVILDDKDSL